MKFSVKNGDLTRQKKACLVVGIYEKGVLSPSAEKLDKISRGFIKKVIKNGEMQGTVGQTLMLYHVPHIPAERILLVGCGKKDGLKDREYRQILTNAVKAISASKAANAISFLTEIPVGHHNDAWKVKQAIKIATHTLYRFDTFKSTKASAEKFTDLQLHIPHAQQLTACKEALKEGLAMANGMTLTKNVANQPSNICTPSYLAEQAKQLAKQYKSMHVKILGEKEMKKLGMGALLAVAQGSSQDAKLICVEYNGGKKNEAPVVLIGKGITFDTGGISLKPADSMVGMKYDMSGGAVVLGTLKAAAELKLSQNVVGIIASAENMPSGIACKPEDIVTTLSGQTVEIMNTDAEGRLVLCDALTYSERYKPDVVIDIATLTGAVLIALGHHATGLLANDDGLAKALLNAGEETYDRAWQMPLWDEYQDQLRSPYADMSNVGGRMAGVITAACFLSRFAKKFKWAHLDVAGTAAMMAGGPDRYATGRPVPLLTQFLINRSKNA